VSFSEAEPARSRHRPAWSPRRRASPRLRPLPAAISAIAAGVIVAGVSVVLAHQPHARQDAPAIVTTPDHYLGVAEANEIASYRPVSEFAAAIGRQPNMVLYYTALGTPFYVRLAREASAHGAVTFVQMNPGRTSLSAVAAGRDDSYLRSFADSVRSFGGPVVIGFAPEMNASWDSWGWHHTKPAVWIAAWRHVVTLFRQQDARNVTWLWTINADVPGSTGPIQRWWPGSAFVDWVGIDGYYYYSSSTFATVFSPTINSVRALTSKPVLISETGIGQVAGQAAKIADLFAGIRASRVVGFVWFDETQHAGIYHQDWRLEGHSAAIAAFRRALSTYYPGQ
jgi:mannan endo-1,4-beta-mannosidase